jgi:hypothetical protein
VIDTINIHDSTIINRSSVMDSYNKLAQRHDESYAKALLELAEVVVKSKDPAANAVFDEFSKESTKDQGDKGKLKRYWDSLVSLVPDVAKLGEAAAKIAGLFA